MIYAGSAIYSRTILSARDTAMCEVNNNVYFRLDSNIIAGNSITGVYIRTEAADEGSAMPCRRLRFFFRSFGPSSRPAHAVMTLEDGSSRRTRFLIRRNSVQYYRLN